GATVAVALPGAELPGGIKLERRKVRGEYSNGMILAEDEVALGPDHAGIMLLDGANEPGTPLGDVLPLVEDVLVVESTGNRPDLLSVYGIAREVAALYDLELAPLPGRDPQPDGDEPLSVSIDDHEGCPRYVARLFRGVRNPLHAFDFSTLAGGRIVVRRARAGERIRTLDGFDRELVPTDLMIADAE